MGTEAGNVSMLEKYSLYIGQLIAEPLDKRTSCLIQNLLDYMSKLKNRLVSSKTRAFESVEYLEGYPAFKPIRHPAYSYDFDYLYKMINFFVREGSAVTCFCLFLGSVAKYIEGNLEVYDYFSSKKCDNEFISLCRGLVIDPSLKTVHRADISRLLLDH